MTIKALCRRGLDSAYAAEAKEKLMFLQGVAQDERVSTLAMTDMPMRMRPRPS